MSVLLVIFLVLILSIALYYGLLGVDMGTINDDYVIPVAILFLLITTGGFAGNNGFTGDFGLDYCNDKDSITNSIVENIREQVSYDETERAVVHSNSFFACELGYINGVVDLGWWVSSFTNGQTVGSGRAMILNHENYKNFVNGETYGFSNFYLSDLESPLGSGETSKYKVGITLHSDTYFFVVDRGYGTNIGGEETGRDLFGPNSPTGSTADPIYFYYVVDLDYDTSGVVTTN
ncbi:MAG: hypothetical protein QF482_00065 [Candidatus Poseidoniia archaeon]|nr:hypothetical protein [Candidatus Poseidoniia archaeon]MDP7095936.1 hypothetical protein [Candidatus Poseidoniia archaeon]HJN31866.1 hypothetical protein [Candidatus Poseidoniia archaeon]